MKTLSNRWPIHLRRIFTHFHLRKSLPGATSAPALFGSSGFRDEFLTFGPMGAVAVVLADPAFLEGIHRSEEWDQ